MLEMQERLELIRQALNVVKSRYLLCILVAQRIHQLERGAAPTIELEPSDQASPKLYLEIALREIIEGNMDLEQITTE